MDIPRIAPCMPGAELTGVRRQRMHSGKVSVRLRPGGADFRWPGEIHRYRRSGFTGARESARQRFQGRGGASNANVDSVSSRRRSVTRVMVKTDLTLSGAVAQYGARIGHDPG